MKRNTLYWLLGLSGVAVANYLIARAYAGTLRTGQPLLAFNDALTKINPLIWLLGQPTAPLASGVTPVVTSTDVVTPTNVVPFPTIGG